MNNPAFRAVAALVAWCGAMVGVSWLKTPESAESGRIAPRPPVTTTVPVPPTTTEFLNNTIASCDDVVAMALKEGWPASELAMVKRVAYRESRCTAGAFNPRDPMGGSIGVYQINSFWCLPSRYYPLGWLQTQGILDTCDDLYNATINTRAALAIWRYADERHGNGWHPWKL